MFTHTRNYPFENDLGSNTSVGLERVNINSRENSDLDLIEITCLATGSLLLAFVLTGLIFLTWLKFARRSYHIPHENRDTDTVIANPNVDSHVLVLDNNTMPRPMSLILEEPLFPEETVAVTVSGQQTESETRHSQPDYIPNGYFYSTVLADHVKSRSKILYAVQWSGYVCFQFQKLILEVISMPDADMEISSELKQLLDTIDIMTTNLVWTPSSDQIEYVCQRITSTIDQNRCDRFQLANDPVRRLKLPNLIFVKISETLSWSFAFDQVQSYQNHVEIQYNKIIRYNLTLEKYFVAVGFNCPRSPRMVTINESHV